jgi:hypothetical protein
MKNLALTPVNSHHVGECVLVSARLAKGNSQAGPLTVVPAACEITPSMALHILRGVGGAAGGLIGALAACASEARVLDDESEAPDAFRLAWICDLSFRVEPGPPHLIGCWIHYDATRDEQQQQRDVAACVAEWLLRRRGIPVSDFAVQHVARLLLTPRSCRRLAIVRV